MCSLQGRVGEREDLRTASAGAISFKLRARMNVAAIELYESIAPLMRHSNLDHARHELRFPCNEDTDCPI